MAEQATEERPNHPLVSLSQALDSGAQEQVRRLINGLTAAEIGDLLESLPPAKRLATWELVDAEFDGEVLVEVGDQVRAQLIRGMEPDELVAAVDDLDLDDLADILEDLPDQVIREVLRAMSRQDRSRLERVLSCDEDSAGGLMDPDVITVRRDVTLDVVLRYLRARGEVPELFDQLFVVNRDGKYLGDLSLATLLTNDPGLTVNELMEPSPAVIPMDMPAAQVALEFEVHDLVSAPVIDAEGHLVGRITIDDVVDVIREAAEHSVLTMAGLDEDDDIFAPVTQSAMRRWLWLGVNLITAFMAAGVLYLFEATLEQVVATAVLFPIVMSMGGIAGTQTLTIMIRGYATGQVNLANQLSLARKELAVGALNGLAFALIIAGIALAWYRDGYLAIAMAIAILLNLLAGALAGIFVPMFLRRLKIDPALAGGVVLTTVTDVVGILAFVGLVSWLVLAR